MEVKTVDQQVLSIVRTVLERCKKEKSSNCLQVPLEDDYERVSFYTGLPKMFVYHVVDNNPYEEDQFDDNDHIILMDCINTFLIGKLNLSIKDLYEEFLKCRKYITYTPDIKTFEKKLYCFGYLFKKNIKSPPLVLIEDPKHKFERYNYLSKIKNYREKNLQIYYIDERNILSCSPFQNPIHDDHKGDKAKKDALTFFHLISADCYENGIFVSRDGNESLEDIFKKWMLDIVLYSIKPESVIVMGNNFIHGLLPTKSITRFHSKKRMLQWLRENDIPCDSNMQKPRLYELIEKCTMINEDFNIDRIFKVNGHHVLRLPVNFPSLTPTKFLWDHINRSFQSYDTNLENMRRMVMDSILTIEKEIWTNFFNQSCNMENRIFEIDLLTEDLLENNCELDEKSMFEYVSNFNIKDILE